MFALLADAVAVLHLLYVLFAVGGEIAIVTGGFLRWAWVRNMPFRLTHLASVLIVAAEAILGVFCPLTEWEHALRREAGQVVRAEMTFVARIVHRIIFYDFPMWVFTALYISFGALVVLTILLAGACRPGRQVTAAALQGAAFRLPAPPRLRRDRSPRLRRTGPAARNERPHRS